MNVSTKFDINHLNHAHSSDAKVNIVHQRQMIPCAKVNIVHQRQMIPCTKANIVQQRQMIPCAQQRQMIPCAKADIVQQRQMIPCAKANIVHQRLNWRLEAIARAHILVNELIRELITWRLHDVDWRTLQTFFCCSCTNAVERPTPKHQTILIRGHF